MTEITRRGALGLAVGAAASPLLPGDVFAAIPAPPPLPLFPAWSVGVEDCMNWKMIFAETAERAMQLYREVDGNLCEGCDGTRCAELNTEGDCEYSGLDAYKISAKVLPPETEGVHGPSLEDMRGAGWSNHCDRHNDVADEWESVDGKVVCHDCMEIDDWREVNPKYHAELCEEREELFWNDFAESVQSFFGSETP